MSKYMFTVTETEDWRGNVPRKPVAVDEIVIEAGTLGEAARAYAAMFCDEDGTEQG